MPTYLRWIAAITSGITAYLAYTIATFPLANSLGTRNANGVIELRGGVGALIAFGSFIVGSLVMLAVNDWLYRRYPRSDAARHEPAPPNDHPAEL